ncbi:hypothetical protein [Enhygromyxa salina]|uniref:Uncharacterized protein n=1 Tax=Enhygromyxa salina TaxID=215803 RepID=A0A2S9YXD2_9BACT|nr:hypothetical protein [Enhygromyxa salina]PRQ09753.1 hypothetical protein ENSA7_05080 [Enhygromyxa salina]
MTDELLHALGRHQREDLSTAPEHVEDERSRPLSDDERATILAAMDDMFAGLDASPAGSAPTGPRPEVAPEVASEPDLEPAPGRVIELAPRRRSVAVIVAVLVSAAAAVALVWLGVSGGPDATGDQQLARVPDYEITQLRGGAASQRSDPDQPADPGTPSLTLRADDEIDWVFTPSEPVGTPVAAALLGRSTDGALRFAPTLAVEASPQGAIRVRGQLASHLALTPGEWTLELLVAEPDQLPQTSQAAAAAGSPGAWRRVEFRVIITAE